LTSGSIARLRSTKKFASENRKESHFLPNEEEEKWIEDYVERETAVGRKRVQDAEIGIMQELNIMTTVENIPVKTRKPESTFGAMLNAIEDSLSNPASFGDKQNGEDEEGNEDATELGKLTDDDEPSWVMCAISKTIQHQMDSYRQIQMRLDKMTWPGCGDGSNCFRERDVKYETAELNVLVVVKPKIDTTAATPSLTTFGEHMHTLDIVGGQSDMLAVPSQPRTVKWGWVQRSHSHRNSQWFFRPMQQLIQSRFRMQSLLNP